MSSTVNRNNKTKTAITEREMWWENKSLIAWFYMILLKLLALFLAPMVLRKKYYATVKICVCYHSVESPKFGGFTE